MNDNSIPEIDALVSQLIDGQLSETETQRLDELLAGSPEALRRYEELIDNHTALSAIYPGEVYEASLNSVNQNAPVFPEPVFPSSLDYESSPTSWRKFALAAALLASLGLGAGYFLGQGSRRSKESNPTSLVNQGPGLSRSNDQSIAGHATLRRSVDLKWSDGSTSYREGDVLPDGPLKFEAGVAEIDFFCGATLIVEGPAELNLKSDWLVHVINGRLRANVPPAARGFVVKTADAEIVDLGTEFALDASADAAYVEVIDGEVKLRGGEHDGDHLVTGESQWLKGSRNKGDAFVGLSTVNDLQRRSHDAEEQRMAEWSQSSMTLRDDKRLVAYYPIAEMPVFPKLQNDRSVLNAATTGSDRDGLIVGPVGRTTGRFGAKSVGLEFDRPGARVRTRIDGEFDALTFTCWARIDRLQHLYNALFMTDGYENGEMHWQILADGRMMFSVMVDDTQTFRHYSRHEQRHVVTAGLAKIYYTDPVWDISRSGQWFHLAVSYDPEGRRVVQYVNGERVSNENIPDKFYVPTLRIGPAEIGNWGQPFRKTPEFSVRNLNGAIDELAIFHSVLKPEEIKAMFEQGRPVGY